MLFSLDLGNKQVKLKAGKIEKVLPSYFVESSQYGNRDLLAFAKTEKDARDYSSPNDNGFTYVWGTELDIEMLRPEQITDTSGFGIRRYTSREYQLLVDFALAELAREFEESKESLKVNVVTGLPTEDYNDRSILEQVAKVIKGPHIVTIDGQSYSVIVEKLLILPQPLGTVGNLVMDDKGTKVDNDFDNANIGVVDLGGGTVLIDALKNMNMAEDNRTQLTNGAYTLFKQISKELSKKGHIISEFELEKVIRNIIGDKYIWSPDGIQKIDITDDVLKQQKLYTRQIASSVKSTYKGFGRMQKILLTGGSANLIDFKEIQRDLFDLCVLVEDSELANVRGFYKFGLAKGFE